MLNLREAPAVRHATAGVFVNPEPREARWPHFGLNVHILEPGQPNAKYHAESVQEGFLVLSGECLLLIEGEERRLRAWDYVHCPPGVAHVFVGAGDGPCRILMVGARAAGSTVHYPVHEAAGRFGASAPRETDSPPEAYSDWSPEFSPEPAGSLLG